MMVKSELEKLGLHPIGIELGEADIEENDIETLKDELINHLKRRVPRSVNGVCIGETYFLLH